MSTIADRINQYLDTKGISRRAFCKTCGFEVSKICRQLKGESQLSADTVDGFVRAYNDVNLTWLLLGSGPMLLDGTDPQPQQVPIVHYNVKASAVADATPRPYQTAAPEAPQILDLAAALDVIKSQQQIIQRQTEMLENLLKNQNQ